MPTTKQETLPKGVGVAKFDFTKTFINQLFSRVRVLYHLYWIINHSESFSPKIYRASVAALKYSTYDDQLHV